VFTNFAIAAYRDTALALGASYSSTSPGTTIIPGVLQEMSDTRIEPHSTFPAPQIIHALAL
jgi:hypothetical protein